MPSQFESLVATSLAALYDQFGLAATYTAPDGTMTDVTVRVHRNDAHQVDRQTRVAGELQTGEIFVRQSELAKPVRGGRFTVEGTEVWTIEITPTLKNGQHHCTSTRTGVDRMMERRAKQ